MPLDEHARLEVRAGRVALVFERILAYPRERVWRALTERTDLEAWHPTPFELDERRAGATVRFRGPAQLGELASGRVLAYEPPRLLAHTWLEDELRWELSEHPMGCLLKLEHVFDDRLKAARDGAGWHVCLSALEDVLAGRERPPSSSPQGAGETWSELNERYQRRFGIAASDATPPPDGYQ